MPLIACPTCDKQISDAAAFVLYAISKDDPLREERIRDRDEIAGCWKEQERKSLAPGSARLVAGVCEKLETDFRLKYGTTP